MPPSMPPPARALGRWHLPYADVALGVFVVAVIGLLIVPVPAWMLDLWLAANLSLSFTVVLVTLYVKRALDIAVFPTLLLLTTLMRLGLNVASTRLILLDGYAGEVIASFGQFVVRGNFKVGLIVFFVLCIIQYVVIAKGSERVAEVGARFVLDAMPGKQMSIDAELRAGAIDPSVARARRKVLERESQFYGAMDGAMKFVKGDVIAGFIITVVNFVGGFALGTLDRGLAPLEALERYGLLTVGDGLVAQIPSMVLAIAAGITVTRVGSEDLPQSLARDFVGQLLGEPKALLASGLFVLVLAAVPGLPTWPFLVVAVGLVIAYSLRVRALRIAPKLTPKASPGDPLSPAFSPLLVPWSLVVGTGWVEGRSARSLERSRQLETKDAPHVASAAEALRHELFAEYGVRLPPCHLAHSTELAEFEVRLEVRERVVTYHLAAQASVLGLEELVPVLRSGLVRQLPSFLGLAGTQALLEALEAVDQVTVRQVVPKVLPLTTLSEVLQRLVSERVSIRDLSFILGALARLAPSESDPYRLTERLREQLREALCYRHTGTGTSIRAITLDPTLEDMVRMSITKHGTSEHLSMSAQAMRDIVSALERAIEQARERLAPASSGGSLLLVTGQEIRRHVRMLVEAHHPDLDVLSYSELLAELTLESVAVASLFGLDSE